MALSSVLFDIPVQRQHHKIFLCKYKYVNRNLSANQKKKSFKKDCGFKGLILNILGVSQNAL